MESSAFCCTCKHNQKMSHLRIVFNKNSCNGLAAPCNRYTQNTEPFSHNNNLLWCTFSSNSHCVCVRRGVCFKAVTAAGTHTYAAAHSWTLNTFISLKAAINCMPGWSLNTQRDLSLWISNPLYTHTHTRTHAHTHTRTHTKFALRQNKTAYRYIGCAVFMPTPSNWEYKSVLQNYKHFLELKYTNLFSNFLLK